MPLGRMLMSSSAGGPLSVPGLTAWYDFSDGSTVWEDAARSNAAEADDVILGISDKSGLGNHATIAANGPQWKAAIQAGKSVGRFDGVNDELRTGASPTISPATAELTVFAVSSISPQGTLFCYGDPGVGGWSITNLSDGASPDTARITTHQVKNYDVTNLWPSGWSVMTFVLDSGKDTTAYANGGIGKSSFHTAFGNSASTGYATIGRAIGSILATGDIGEILVYTGALSRADTNLIGRYLAAKWGLTWTNIEIPQYVAGLTAWYDFSDISTLWKDTARTDPVTADADVILGVTDKSSAASHLSVAVNGPAYKTAIQSGKSVARFDGVNDYLSGTLSGLTAWTAFAILRPTSGTTNSYVWTLTNNYNAIITGFVDNTYEWFENGTRAQVGANSSSVFNDVVVTRPVHAGTYATYLDGVAGATAATTATAQAVNKIGADSPGFSHYSGDIAELVLYNSVLTAAQINTVGNYLASKWGLTWTTVT